MTETPQILLGHHLKALKLPTFLREYENVAQQCAAVGVDHPRYLMRLTEMEMIDRERRMVERRISGRYLPSIEPDAVFRDRSDGFILEANNVWPRTERARGYVREID